MTWPIGGARSADALDGIGASRAFVSRAAAGVRHGPGERSAAGARRDREDRMAHEPQTKTNARGPGTTKAADAARQIEGPRAREDHAPAIRRHVAASSPPSRDEIMVLQRSVGNRFVQRF